MKRIVLVAVLAMVPAERPAWSGFADAVQAYDGGDYATALNESLAAARQGDADAQYMAGFLFMRGQGTRTDLRRAYQWFSLAAQKGDEFAADELQGLTARMTAAQISQAEAWLRDWKPAD